MANVQKYEGKRGTTYRVMWRTEDGKQTGKTVKTYDEARRLRTSVEALEQRGKAPDPRKGAQTLRDWSEAFMGTLHLKPQTQANYESLLRSRILPAFGDRRIDSIKRLDVQQWVAGMAREVSPKRTTAAYRLLSQMLSEAVKNDVLLTNPAVDVKLPAVEKRDVAVLTVEELKKVASHCGRYQTLVLFLGVMGTRWAETIGLTHDKVRDGVAVIDSSLSETGGLLERVTTKTNEIRRLPIPAFLLDRTPNGEGLVFQTTYGNPVRSGHFRENVFKPALVKAKVEEIRIHDLRHCAASILIDHGASIKAVQAWLGHSSAQITLDRYSHLFPSDLDELAHKMDHLLSGD